MKVLIWAFLTFVQAFSSAVPARSSSTFSDRVTNPATEPSFRTLHLKELWRVGGDTEAEGEVFGQIGDVAVDQDRNVYLLDRQTKDVRMFTSDGIYVRSFGRDGEGPGEFRQPVGLVVTPSNQIGVYQPHPVKLVLFDRSGKPSGDLNFELDPGHMIQFMMRVQCAGDSFLVTGVDYRQYAGGMDHVIPLLRFDASGKFMCELARTVRHFDFGKPLVRDDDRPPRAAVDRTGVAYVSSNWNYEIQIRAVGCEKVRMVERKYTHRRRTSAEISRIESYFREGGGTQGATLDISKYDPDIRWMAVDRHDRLWVLTSRGCVDHADDSLGTFDIFDSSGKLVEAVDLKAEGSFATDGYFLIGNRFYLLRHGRAAKDEKTEDAEPMSVICYEIPGA